MFQRVGFYVEDDTFGSQRYGLGEERNHSRETDRDALRAGRPDPSALPDFYPRVRGGFGGFYEAIQEYYEKDGIRIQMEIYQGLKLQREQTISHLRRDGGIRPVLVRGSVEVAQPQFWKIPCLVGLFSLPQDNQPSYIIFNTLYLITCYVGGLEVKAALCEIFKGAPPKPKIVHFSPKWDRGLRAPTLILS